MIRVDFRMPSLGADMESGTLTQWLKKPGEHIRRGDPIAVVETSKGLIDVESFDDGVLVELIAQPGAVLPIGAVMARIDSESATTAPAEAAAQARPAAGATTIPATVAAAPPPVAAAAPSAATAQAATAEAATPAAATRVRISPAARRRAHELGIDPASVRGGPDGLIRIEDVERLALASREQQPQVPRPQTPQVPPAQAPRPRADLHAAMRTAIGAAMARSKREIPHYYLAHDVDFGPARAWLTQFNAALPVGERLIDAVLLVKAVALAAAEMEGFNGYYQDGRFQRSGAVHLGTAIALRGGGLVAPALLDADRKDLKTLMRDFSDLVTRVRSGHMRSSELSSATLTLTSLGADAVDSLFPVISPPQVAIIGAGAVTERPWVRDGALTVRPVLTVTLAADHRVTDGRAGSRLLRRIAELLAHPEAL